MTLDIIKLQTTWNDAAGSINSNYAKIADAIAQLKANGGGGGGGADIDLTDYATKVWVEAQGYITASALTPYLKTEDAEETYATKDFVNNKLVDYAPLTSVQGFENRIGGLEGAVPQLNERVTIVEGKVSSLNETVSTGENNLLDRVNVIEEEYATKTYVDNAIGGIDLSPYLLKADLTKSRIQSTLGISDWALAATKPSYAWSEITSRPTALSQFTDDVVDGKYLHSVRYSDTWDADSIYSAGIFSGRISHLPSGEPYGRILSLPYYNDKSEGTQNFVAHLFITNGDDTITPNEMFFRTAQRNAWNEWNKVITDKNISNYNAGSATKLQTRRTLWGQSFDGTDNISGAITLANNQSINVTFTDGTIKNALLLASSNNNLYLGYGTALSGASTFLWGKEIQFVNSSGQPIATFKDDKLGIGTNSPNVLLTVNGELRAAASIYLHNTNEINSFHGKLYLNHRGSGQTGYGSTNDIVMVGHGGNVGIGHASPAERLDVSGNIKASGNINATSITINGVTITASNGSITVNGNVFATGDITGFV